MTSIKGMDVVEAPVIVVPVVAFVAWVYEEENIRRSRHPPRLIASVIGFATRRSKPLAGVRWIPARIHQRHDCRLDRLLRRYPINLPSSS
jgi:hypothetical protein